MRTFARKSDKRQCQASQFKSNGNPIVKRGTATDVLG